MGLSLVIMTLIATLCAVYLLNRCEYMTNITAKYKASEGKYLIKKWLRCMYCQSFWFALAFSLLFWLLPSPAPEMLLTFILLGTTLTALENMDDKESL